MTYPYPQGSSSPSINRSGNVDVTKPFTPSAQPPTTTGTGNNVYNSEWLDLPIFERNDKINDPNADFNIRTGKLNDVGKLEGVYSKGVDKFNQMPFLFASNQTAYAAYQTMLWKAGIYKGSTPVLGLYTDADAKAMDNLLTGYAQLESAGVHMSWDEYMGNVQNIALHANYGSGGGGFGGGRAPLTISYTDPAELKQTLQQAAQNALGRNLNDKELNAFVSHFHGQEAGAQRAAYNGATSVTNPSASGEAMQQMDDQHQSEEQGRLQATYLDALNQMLGNK